MIVYGESYTVMLNVLCISVLFTRDDLLFIHAQNTEHVNPKVDTF